MRFPRSSGVLLHPTSLPGRYGIGDLGISAYQFIDVMASAAQSLWQVMPLGPTSFGDSPYQCLSSCAGNPLLISPDVLAGQGLLPDGALDQVPEFPEDRVDYGPVIEWKMGLLKSSFHHFQQHGDGGTKQRMENFCRDQHYWLDHYALFKALKDHHGGKTWSEWEPGIANPSGEGVGRWEQQLAEDIWSQKYYQFLFWSQWRELRGYANSRGIKIIGDMPIFVGLDSADVWANRELFHIGDDGKALKVAGVPPDYFSVTGQLWGNPIYRWNVMDDQKYSWWVRRFKASFAMVDILRIDHFRGFEAAWEVDGGEETAVKGEWVKVPGKELFRTVEARLGTLPIIAEDLGVITPEVRALKDGCGFPGMKVIQFGFGSGALNEFLPHNFDRESVVYTGTHDNDTTRGWYDSQPQEVQAHVQRYLGVDDSDVVWELIRQAMRSVACIAIIPMQDLLDLGTEARMNQPSIACGNWDWRVGHDQVSQETISRLEEMTVLYGRDCRGS